MANARAVTLPIQAARAALLAMTLRAALLEGQQPAIQDSMPIHADHHTHLVSPVTREILRRAGLAIDVVQASDLIAVLDSAGIRRAAVLSMAYALGGPESASRGQDAGGPDLVRAENDWVAKQVAPYAGRLIGFCGVDPLVPSALNELNRCIALGLRGLKLHLANATVNLRDADHLARLRTVFAAANAARVPIVVHLRTRDPAFGAADARNFIEWVLPAARDVPVQVAHLSGWGGYDAGTDSALAAFTHAFASRALDRANVYLELSAVTPPPAAFEAPAGSMLRVLADQVRGFPGWETTLRRRIRELDGERILFGSDWPFLSPVEYGKLLRARLGLDPRELSEILDNVAPYLTETGKGGQ